jgi:prepilin-type N-terminal cleavage/methylation domain-containing protein
MKGIDGVDRVRGERGMTLVEVLVVVAVVGLLANLAVPAGFWLMKRTQAQAVVNDFNQVQQAAIQYHLDKGGYPADCSPGQEPPELSRYIKGKVAWANTTTDVQYDWENWTGAGGMPIYPQYGVRVGMTVETSDASLIDMIERIYPGPYVTTFRSTRITIAILQ